jgi:hypothetical protein
MMAANVPVPRRFPGKVFVAEESPKQSTLKVEKRTSADKENGYKLRVRSWRPIPSAHNQPPPQNFRADSNRTLLYRSAKSIVMENKARGRKTARQRVQALRGQPGQFHVNTSCLLGFGAVSLNAPWN